MSEDKGLKKATKKGLKTMQKTRAKHPLREEGRILKYGTKGFARYIWLSTAATVEMAKQRRFGSSGSVVSSSCGFRFGKKNNGRRAAWAMAASRTFPATIVADDQPSGSEITRLNCSKIVR